MLFFPKHNFHRHYTIPILVLCYIFILNCDSDFSSIQSDQEIIKPKLKLSIEKVRVKELWLNLKTKESGDQIFIYRDTLTIFEDNIKAPDTIIYDFNLFPKHEYSYIAYQIHNSIAIDSSSRIDVKTKDYIWNFLGLPDTFALRLKISEPQLYVCAGVYGLWRTNILVSQMNWKYLGLADTISNCVSTYGVQDILIHSDNNDVILAATRPEQVERHSIYKSINGGNTWIASDSGLGWVYDHYGPLYASIKRLVVCSDHIVAAGAGVFYSENFGEYWQLIPGNGFGFVHALENHPKFPNIVWAGGDDVASQPFLFYSVNSGLNWTFVNIFPIVGWLNSVHSIGFDPIDENIVYVGLSELIKTTDGGQNWSIILNRYVRKILVDPNNNKHIWVAVGGSDIHETWNGGETWVSLVDPIPADAFIKDMVWHENTETVFVATLKGVYYFVP